MSQYLGGKIPMNYLTLHGFCRLLGIEASSIRTDLPEQQLGIEPDTSDWADVEGFQANIALGDGAANEEWQEAHKLKFRASSLRRQGLFPGNLQVFYGRGDSMEPRIHDGDAILVDRSDTRPVDDGIFMLENEDGAYAKRLSKIDGRWFVTSDNGHDPKWRKPVALEGRKPFKILGRVRWVGSWVK
ncbi:S24 family peptidase [Pseudoxanthomonas sp. JBR18]|uniref:S24 family peptidase n=1 Tax=Pseudoxanthomonas sp. JBR18 TaxID=2969308 RepID=UPI0023059C1A|nr:S24 family peptidase [Pseudoxanthomonas sp. JBR18]WCE04462.1 S24 family peptidase [Pseudoxanthomonas sp. JBR18]